MIYPSIAKQVQLLYRYAETLPQGVIEITLEEDNLDSLCIKVTPDKGLYKSVPIKLRVNFSTFSYNKIQIYSVESAAHPNLGFWSSSNYIDLPYSCHTLASRLEHVVHSLYYPDFGFGCLNKDFETDEDVEEFLKNEVPQVDSRYPYFTDESLQALNCPSMEWLTPGLTDTRFPINYCMDIFGSLKDCVFVCAVFQVIIISDDKFVYFERGFMNYLPSLIVSMLTEGSFDWQSSEPTDNDNELSSHLDGELRCIFPYEVKYIPNPEVSIKMRDFDGNQISSLVEFSFNASLNNEIENWHFESEVLKFIANKGGLRYYKKCNWPLFMAPGRCLPECLFKSMQYRVGYSDAKRASSTRLLLDFYRRIKQTSDLNIYLIDPMALSISDAIICHSYVTNSLTVKGKNWFTVRELLVSPVSCSHELGMKSYLSLTGLSIASIIQNYVFLLHRLELYAQLGLSRPAEDTSALPGSIHHSNTAHKNLSMFCNSVALFDGLPSFLLYKFVDVFSFLCKFTLPKVKLNSRTIVMRPFSDLNEI